MPRHRRIAWAVGLLSLLGVTRAGAATYYVTSTGGSDDADGTSPETAWATVTHAAAVATAGDTVYIKAGVYQGEEVVVRGAGTAQAPIIFQGYTSVPGEVVDPAFVPGEALRSDLIPVLEGPGTEGEAIGFDIGNKMYVEVRYLGATRWNYGFFPYSSAHITLDHVYAVANGPSDGFGIILRSCTDSTVKDSVSADSWGDNVLVWKSQRITVENVHTYSVAYDPPAAATDYHIIVADTQDSVIRGCVAENLHTQIADAHPGHGIGVKDWTDGATYPNPHSTGNQFIDCEARNTYESFWVAHEAHDNLFLGCRAYADRAFQDRSWAGIILRDGAYDNTFRDFRAEGFRSAVILQDTVEGPADRAEEQIVHGNVIENSVFVDTVKGIEIWSADDNLLRNCVFDRTGSWVFVRFPFERVGHGNSCRNSIVTNIAGDLFLADVGSSETFRFTYSDFADNLFAMPEGKGNFALDPLFVDAAAGDYHLRSAAGRWDDATSSWVTDSETSPAIDTGDPDDDFTTEPAPNGCRVDQGAYGNTAEASHGADLGVCPERSSESGCGCRTGAGEEGPAAGALLVAAALLLVRRRSAS
jgi:MYXO-CTERM domain-containing protein